MSIVSWMRERVCGIPLPAPEQVKPEPSPLLRPAPDAKISADAIQEEMNQVFEENSRAAMSSLATSAKAITAEERSRSVLDDLMREMDRGRNSGKT
jgi:hypothetical protein